jgi:hypothetical protein
LLAERHARTRLHIALTDCAPPQAYKELLDRRMNSKGDAEYHVLWGDDSKTWEPNHNILDASDHWEQRIDKRPVRKLKWSGEGWSGMVGHTPDYEWIQLEPEWVTENFIPQFVAECQTRKDVALIVPDGRAPAPSAASPLAAPPGPPFGGGVRGSDVPVVKYQQGGLDACVAYSAASAASHAGLVDGNGASIDEKIVAVFDAASTSPLRDVETFIHDCVVGVRVKRLKNPQLADLLEPSPFPRILALLDSDGGSNHVVTTVGSWIFDSNHEHAVPLSKGGFDACCLEDTTLDRVIMAVQVYPPGRKMVALWKQPPQLRKLPDTTCGASHCAMRID